jgi:hypothetical protein
MAPIAKVAKPLRANRASVILTLLIRGVAQLGSAPLWGSGGRKFESCRSDSFSSQVTPSLGKQTSRQSLTRGFLMTADLRRAVAGQRLHSGRRFWWATNNLLHADLKRYQFLAIKLESIQGPGLVAACGFRHDAGRFGRAAALAPWVAAASSGMAVPPALGLAIAPWLSPWQHVLALGCRDRRSPCGQWVLANSSRAMDCARIEGWLVARRLSTRAGMRNSSSHRSASRSPQLLYGVYFLIFLLPESTM